MARLDPLSLHDRGAGDGHARPAGHHSRPDLAHAAAAAGADGLAGECRRQRRDGSLDPCRGAAAAHRSLAAARRTCRCARTGAARARPAHPVAGRSWHAAPASAELARGVCRADRGRPADHRTAGASPASMRIWRRWTPARCRHREQRSSAARTGISLHGSPRRVPMARPG